MTDDLFEKQPNNDKEFVMGEWKDMPEFNQEDLTPYRVINVRFRNEEDVAKFVWRFNRWHHHVDYKPYKKNKLIKKEGLIIPEGNNEYGMKLISLDDAK
jgi:hypothetical protein